MNSNSQISFLISVCPPSSRLTIFPLEPPNHHHGRAECVFPLTLPQKIRAAAKVPISPHHTPFDFSSCVIRVSGRIEYHQKTA